MLEFAPVTNNEIIIPPLRWNVMPGSGCNHSLVAAEIISVGREGAAPCWLLNAEQEAGEVFTGPALRPPVEFTLSLYQA